MANLGSVTLGLSHNSPSPVGKGWDGGSALSSVEPHSFEFASKSKQVDMRFPEALLDAVEAKAAAQGVTNQRFIRQVLERALG